MISTNSLQRRVWVAQLEEGGCGRLGTRVATEVGHRGRTVKRGGERDEQQNAKLRVESNLSKLIYAGFDLSPFL